MKPSQSNDQHIKFYVNNAGKWTWMTVGPYGWSNVRVTHKDRLVATLFIADLNRKKHAETKTIQDPQDLGPVC